MNKKNYAYSSCFSSGHFRTLSLTGLVADDVGIISDTVSNIPDSVSNVSDIVGNLFCQQENPER